MCHHLDVRDWEAIREEAFEPEPTEPTDDAELSEKPERRERELVAPTADD